MPIYKLLVEMNAQRVKGMASLWMNPRDGGNVRLYLELMDDTRGGLARYVKLRLPGGNAFGADDQNALIVSVVVWCALVISSALIAGFEWERC